MKTRYALLSVAIVGLVTATVGTDIVDNPTVSLGLAIGGWVILWAGVLGAEYSSRSGYRDERFAQIYYRAGYYSWLLLLVLGSLVVIAADVIPLEISMRHAAMSVVGLSIVAYAVLADWFQKRM